MRIRFSKEEWRRLRLNERDLGIVGRKTMDYRRRPVKGTTCECGERKGRKDICCVGCSRHGHSHRVVVRPCVGCGRPICQVQHFVMGSALFQHPRLGWVATDHAKRCKKCREGSI